MSTKPARPRVATLTLTAAAAALTTAAVLLVAPTQALFEPGTPGRDVHYGWDNEVPGNRLIQPAGVRRPQHMDRADVMFGRDNQDLLFGNSGADTLLGGEGSDILVGGPDSGASPPNDVLVGEDGPDVAVWPFDDGNDAFIGDLGTDAVVIGALQLRSGRPRLQEFKGRRVPVVAVSDQQSYTCELEQIPETPETSIQFLVRLYRTDGHVLLNTLRIKDVERVVCPGPVPGQVLVARPVAGRDFEPAPAASLTGLLGAIVNGA